MMQATFTGREDCMTYSDISATTCPRCGCEAAQIVLVAASGDFVEVDCRHCGLHTSDEIVPEHDCAP